MASIPTCKLVVAVALRDSAGRFLLSKRPVGKAHAGLWEFPGGKVEPGERPRQALKREIEEELGITLDPGKLFPAGFADHSGNASDVGLVLLLYVCSEWSGTIRSDLAGQCCWVTWSDFDQFQMPPLDLCLIPTLQTFAKCGWPCAADEG